MTGAKKVLILTADAGFGHRSAANAVAAALKEKYENSLQVDIVNPMDDERTPALLRDSQSDYDRLVREMPEVYRLQYQISGLPPATTLVESAVTVMLYRVMQDTLQRFQPDIVVVTYPLYNAPLGAAIALGKINLPFFTVVTDMGSVHRSWFNPTADLCMVPGELAFNAALESGFPREKLRVTGIPVHPRLVNETRSKAEIRAELGWDPLMTTVLVAGSKRVKNLEPILHVLNHSGLPFQYALVAGGDEERFANFQTVEWHPLTHCYNYVRSMPAFMNAADLIICKAGGLIVTEALACGLPMLLVDITPGQEEGNAEQVVKSGAGQVALTPIDALEAIFHWQDKSGVLLQQASNAARRLGKPRAAFTIAELVWEAAQSGSLPFPESRLKLLPRLRELLKQVGISSSSISSDEIDSP